MIRVLYNNKQYLLSSHVLLALPEAFYICYSIQAKRGQVTCEATQLGKGEARIHIQAV